MLLSEGEQIRMKSGSFVRKALKFFFKKSEINIELMDDEKKKKKEKHREEKKWSIKRNKKEREREKQEGREERKINSPKL